MKPTVVTVERRFSLGNYESELLSITAELEEGEKANEVIQKLRLNLIAQHKKPVLASDNSVASRIAGK
jgi:hypothetical protein